MKPLKILKIRIELEAQFGSGLQEEFGKGALNLMLNAWSQYLSRSHRKNKIIFSDYVIEEKLGGDVS